MNSEWRGAHQQEAQGLNAGLDYVFDHQVNSEWRGEFRLGFKCGFRLWVCSPGEF